jgi:hypothetical protein
VRNLFINKDGFVVELVDVSLCQQGGGAIFKTSASNFCRDFEPFAFGAYKPGQFAIDDGDRYQGFWDGRYWNGWATPCFTIDEMMKMATDWPNLVYDEALGVFRLEDYDNPENTALIERRDIDVNGRVMKLFTFDGFCWEKVDE